MQSPLDNTELSTRDTDKIKRVRELMPPPLLNEVFKQNITPSHLALMKEELEDCLNDLSFPARIVNMDKTVIWTCIVFGDRTSAPTDMIQLAEVLKIELIELFPIACYIGDKGLLDCILKGKTEAEKLELIKYDNYAGYSGANRQDSDVRTYLEQQTGKLLNQDLEKNNYQSAFALFESALKKGHHDVLFHLNALFPDFLVTLHKTTHGGGTDDYHDLLCLASSLGVINALGELLSFIPSQVTQLNYKMVRVAGDNNCMDVLIYIKDRCPDLKQLDIFYEYNGIINDYCTQAKNGSLDALKLIEELHDKEFTEELIQHNNYEVFRGAAEGGHLNVIQHLENTLDTTEKCENMVKANDFEGFALAVANKNVDVAKHLLTYKNCYDTVSNNARNESVDAVLRLFDDEQSKIDALTKAIAKLRDYGTKLTEEDQDDVSKAEGRKTIDYARGLETLKNNFLTAKKTSNFDELNDLQNRFREQLVEGEQLMGTHRAEWKSILAEIALALTGIGLILTIGKYVLTGNTFFSQTKRQKDVEEINTSFEEYFNQCN